jgi:hypothetical protein
MKRLFYPILVMLLAIGLALPAAAVMAEEELAQTLFLNVTRSSPTAAAFNVDSEETFSVTLQISNDSTAGDAGRTMNGNYSLTYSGLLSLSSGPSASGTFSSLAKNSPISYTWTFTAPSVTSDTEIVDAINLAATVTSINPSRTFPSGGDKTTDTKSYKVTIIAPVGGVSITAPGDIIGYEGNTTGGATGIALGSPTVSGGTPPYTISNNAPGTFPLGDTIVTWTVTDSLSATATDTQTVNVVDTTDPVITVLLDPVNVIVGAPSSVLDGTVTASDIVDPSPTLTNDAPANFPPGTTTVTWTATDASGNSATATQQVNATYNFGDFLPPLVINGQGNGLFKAGSTIPVKFQLFDYDGNPVSDATGTASIDTDPAASAAIRYDVIAMQYIANLKTPKGVLGDYTITVSLNDGSTHTISVTLK